MTGTKLRAVDERARVVLPADGVFGPSRYGVLLRPLGKVTRREPRPTVVVVVVAVVVGSTRARVVRLVVPWLTAAPVKAVVVVTTA